MGTKQVSAKAIGGLLISVILLTVPAAFGGLVAFEYEPVEDTILSATFSVDLAALTAHRTVSGSETNFAKLIDVSGGLGEYDLSDDLFGTAAFPNPPLIDMGVLETGIFSALIDSSFFSALATGQVGLHALFTDTYDAMFAIDFISLTIETNVTTIESYYGWPVGSENNGFGIGLADGGDLPGALPDSVPIGATGTGFDETISSKSIYEVPEPAMLLVLGLGGLFLRRGKKYIFKGEIICNF